jgi:hypothetical protein
MRPSGIAQLLQVARPPAPYGARTLARCYTIEDVAKRARRRLPLGSRAYLDTGGEAAVVLGACTTPAMTSSLCAARHLPLALLRG